MLFETFPKIKGLRMKNSTKIATCCYCGARSVLKLTARDGHELACGSCGAPLHNLKWLKQGHETPRRDAKRSPARAQPRKQKKKRKSTFSRVVETIWDEIEDIFD